MFYLIAPFVLRSLFLSLIVFLLSLSIRLICINAFGFHQIWTYTFFPSTIMFFMIGHFARLIYERITYKIRGYHLLFGLLAIIFSYEISKSSFDGVYFYCFLSSFILFIPYIFEKTKNIRWLNYMGDLSYPLYLSHPLVLFWICGLTEWKKNSVISMTFFNQITQKIGCFYATYILFFCCVLVSILLHRFVPMHLPGKFYSKRAIT